MLISDEKAQLSLFPSLPVPAKTLRIYRRAILGRKHLFAQSDSDHGQYFVKNPIPNKHADKWKPIFYRGDNPKYTPTTKAIGRARRSGLWDSFRIELGDGVEEVLQNKRRIRERKWYQTKQKFRKWFCMAPTPPKKPLEDTQEVQGLVMPLRMRKPDFLTRSLQFTIGGETYTWSGTRRFLPKWSKRWKGVSHDLKLVNSDNVVIATFEKDRWASFKKAQKTEDPANKKKSYLGTLSIFPSASPSTPACINHARQTAEQDELDPSKKPKPKKHTKYINFDGSHSGEITEETIVFTCWIAIEAEHRLRYKIFDILQAIGEILGG
ncbi:hypothetical protein BGZ61DRAFT_353317 [Ilyonectria robusta]|uniref:uncharacterized protein n=1 Tax=Ilyonectria robusta TaxID=1079257 RepID=UPI001E8E1EFE|nr:uncharacterized protein BGZ61DRAFT_353317 [Ilyonectria robusta]KAH8688476.1 hypothetical protein BGZ61DRAFT_353317 [Ilyonectria robusta]